jgi:hypothetical protein
MTCNDLFTPHDAKNYRTFNIWLMVSMFTFAAVTIVLDVDRALVSGAPAAALVAITIVFLTVAVAMYLRFIREADELLRKIHIDGLAAGFGAGAIFMLGYRLCERIGAPKLDVDDGFLVMMLFWALGQYLGYRRYSAVEA